MKLSRKVICLFLILVISVSMNISTYADDSLEDKGYTTYNTIICDEIGETETAEAAMRLDKFIEYGNPLINSFKVLDNKIYVLDAVNLKLMIYEDKIKTDTIDISFCVNPYYFTVDSDGIVIFDYTSLGIIYYLNHVGGIMDAKVLTGEIPIYTITGFCQLDGISYLIDYNKNLITLDNLQMAGSMFNITSNDYSCNIEYRNLTWRFDKTNKEFYSPLYVDQHNNLYVEKVILASGTNVIAGETYLLKIDADGNEVSSMRLKLEEYSNFPKTYYDFVDDKVYVLELYENKFAVSLAELGDIIEPSRIEEIEKKINENRIETAKISGTKVLKSRNQVYNDTYGIIGCGWVVNEGNNTPPSGVILPMCVSNAQIGDTIVGIPYCWGGYSSNLSIIINELNAGLTAGNTSNATDWIVPGTTGYDCSGFVSYCYGIGYYSITSFMLSDIELYEIENTDMGLMDLIHKVGHAMLFCSYNNSGNSITVCESTSDGDGRARVFTYQFTTILSNKTTYAAYSPW